MTIGENIRRIRKEKGLTQKKLGALCGINEVQIRQYELGKAKPKIETIDKIAKALEVNITAIMEQLTFEQFIEINKDKHDAAEREREAEDEARDVIFSLLANIYGKVEVEGDYACYFYYVVGEGDKQFILYERDIDTLYKAIKGFILPLVDRIKDTTPKEEAFKRYQEALKDIGQ